MPFAATTSASTYRGSPSIHIFLSFFLVLSVPTESCRHCELLPCLRRVLSSSSCQILSIFVVCISGYDLYIVIRIPA
ncbi:hypothetical protein EJ05DRAFT_58715 [Pseudovirgaria hyperparasitica]|uniref:Uncharacterized protein n=1 Tax=Pseudovirgaria hyperparasitica TaxID=470096 RepID=A0A6A6W2Q0_9PEZI|nr:uncharacterized protein EJ05DRAFT_58715 [Pseudovirgaria hyperparasitica]KAF2757208.1 hypothetical protein EJ05DRAFT_58715 [Pseudovirgaria hyperparasitica]